MKKVLLLLSLLLPSQAMAEVYMCVDPATGKKTFTDRACPQRTAGQNVRVDRTNYADGRSDSTARKPDRSDGGRAWNSQRDTRVSGVANYYRVDEDMRERQMQAQASSQGGGDAH